MAETVKRKLIKIIPRSSIIYFIIVIVLFITLCVSAARSNIFSGILLLLSFIVGSAGCQFLLKSKEFPVNGITHFFKWERTVAPGFVHSKKCVVCGNRKCKRHRPELSVQVLKPWTDLMVPAEVDEALDEILTLTLKEYVFSWYNDLITQDEAFIQEVRVSLRFLFASLYKRAQQVDLINLIAGKLFKALIQHLDCCLHAVKKNPCSVSDTSVESVVLRHLYSSVHVALRSRNEEVQYLRTLTERIMPYIIPKKSSQSKSACSLVREILSESLLLPSMDILADPDIINYLLTIFFDKTPMVIYPESDEPKVEILHNFVGAENASHSVLLTDLQTILSHQQLLFPFMQFLKEEAAVNVLQFCLGVEDFNKRILNPDLTLEQMVSLQKEVQEMFQTYFAHGAVDRINFDDDVVNEMKAIVDGPPKDVVKLRTTTSLFRAYDHAYGLLETIYCPLFHQSDRYFSLLCGDRLNSGTNRGGLWRPNKKAEQSTMSRLGNKLKGVFAPTIDNGRPFEEEAGLDLGEALFADSHSDDESYRLDDPRLKDLSAWRISIPRVDTLMDLNCKYYDAFMIEVQRIDVRDDDNPEDLHWKVHRKAVSMFLSCLVVRRRYQEFYILASKLTEFHGESLDIQLPAKKSFGNKGRQFLESRRAVFEKFLQDLLSVPSLRGSELLYKFLKSPVEFTSSFLTDINFGKMIKTVPMKLMKEKGQHLLPFLQTFVTSTEAAKPKPSKMEWKEIFEIPEPLVNEKLQSTIYKDNCSDISLGKSLPKNIGSFLSAETVNVYRIPSLFLRILLTFEMPTRNLLQAYVEWYLDTKLKQAMHSLRITSLLHHLRDALFLEKDAVRSDAQKEHTKRVALREVENFFPDCLVRILGRKRFKDGTNTLFSLLQYPRLNKQLSYVLLDIVMLELFPELRDDSPSPL